MLALESERKCIERQYLSALAMLRSCIEQYEEDLWLEAEGHSNPAWQIAYHAVFFANIYCASNEGAVIHWPQEIENCHMLGLTPWPPHEKIIPASTLSRKAVLEFLDYVTLHVPAYLENFEPDEPCWPFWYDLLQREFQMNSLRHIQNHIGQLLERQASKKPIALQWR